MRYSRQELVIGSKAQEQLSKASIAIVGLGALGTVSADLLARAGIGTIKLIDRDIVELSNLQRQTLYQEEDVGKFKAERAFSRLEKTNAQTNLTYVIDDLNHKNIGSLLNHHDLILDCTDNIYSRFLINEYSRKTGIPWVYSAAIRDHGNVMGITRETPCLRCVFEEPGSSETCDTAGILNTASGAVSCFAVNEAIRILTGKFNEQSLISLNINTMRLTKVRPEHREDCPACNRKFEYLTGEKEPLIKQLCANTFQFYFDGLDVEELAGRLRKLGKVVEGKGYVFFGNISAFSNGRVFVKAENMEQAKSAVSKYIGN